VFSGGRILASSGETVVPARPARPFDVRAAYLVGSGGRWTVARARGPLRSRRS